MNRRLERLAAAPADKPAASVPHAPDDWGQTKAAYRSWDNERVTPADSYDAHRRAAVARLPDAGVVLAIQDATTLSFTGHKAVRGLGCLAKRHQRGLPVHSLPAVSDDGVPLGVARQEVWARSCRRFGRRRGRRRTAPPESQRRLTAVREAAAPATPGVPSWWRPTARPIGSTCWRPHARRGWTCSCGPSRAAAPVVATLTVTPPRADDRPARTAALAPRAAAVTLERPSVHPRRRFPRPAPAWVILAEQTDAAAGDAPLWWLLLRAAPPLSRPPGPL